MVREHARRAANAVEGAVLNRLPPGPPPRRGVVDAIRYYGGFALDPIGFVERRFRDHGDLYYAPARDGGLYVVKHPDHVREVLTTRASSFSKEHSAFTVLSRVLGEGLLTTDGATWARQRRMVQPAFAKSRMAGYARVMIEESRRTSSEWERRRVLDMRESMSALTLRIVSRTLFGHEVPDADMRAIGRGMEAFQRSLSSPDFLPKWIPTPDRRELARSLKTLDRIVEGLVAQGSNRSADASRSELLSMLTTAVDAETGTKLSAKEIRDQLVTLFLAGHETTSNALTWTWACLAKNPDAERALHAELDEVLDGRAPELADLERLPYTEQIISESMRLYPPIYVIARRASEDTEIGGYPVPRGAEVVIWVYFTHRDPKLFVDPEAFRPERFAADVPAGAYLPFGAGPRACIGKTFAMLEARLILATLAQRHRPVLARGQSMAVKPRITLTPKRAMRMQISSR